LFQVVPQPAGCALRADGRARDDQLDGFTPLGMRAAGQLRELVLYLGEDRGIGGVDKRKQ
jgi:hypothetical protein